MKKIIRSTHDSKTRDPFIIKHNGMYYQIFTHDCLVLSMVCSETIEGLENATPKVVWTPDKEEYSKELWHLNYIF